MIMCTWAFAFGTILQQPLHTSFKHGRKSIKHQLQQCKPQARVTNSAPSHMQRSSQQATAAEITTTTELMLVQEALQEITGLTPPLPHLEFLHTLVMVVRQVLLSHESHQRILVCTISSHNRCQQNLLQCQSLTQQKMRGIHVTDHLLKPCLPYLLVRIILLTKITLVEIRRMMVLSC